MGRKFIALGTLAVGAVIVSGTVTRDGYTQYIKPPRTIESIEVEDMPHFEDSLYQSFIETTFTAVS